MRLVFVFLSCSLVLLLTGCLHHRVAENSTLAPQEVKTVKPVVTPDTALIGEVFTSNPSAKIVVLRFPLGRMAAANQRLNVYREGLKVGEVVVSGPQLDDMIAGDVVAGEALKGDTVRSN